MDLYTISRNFKRELNLGNQADKRLLSANAVENEVAQKFKWSEEKIQQLVKEGRGKGKGATYRPWIEVTDFSSQGNSRRVFSQKTGRLHHLLSDAEWQLFTLLEFATNVTDIREQYPLERAETLSLAAQRAIKHPMYPGTKVPVVMTVDFLVELNREGQRELHAFSCKRTEDTIPSRMVELLELERAYFDDLGIAHHLVFHSTIPQKQVKNIVWIRGAHLDNTNGESPDDFHEHAQRVIDELGRHARSCSLEEYCANYDMRSGAQAGTGLRVVRALLWRRRLTTDFNQPELAKAPVSMFRVTPQSPTDLGA